MTTTPTTRRFRSPKLVGPLVATSIRLFAADRQGVSRAARREGISQSEFLNRSVKERLGRVLNCEREPAA